jgi:hypothetical protein
MYNKVSGYWNYRTNSLLKKVGKSLRKCFEIGLSLAWIATPVLTDGVRKSKPTSSKTASKLAGFGDPAKQQGISKTPFFELIHRAQNFEVLPELNRRR